MALSRDYFNDPALGEGEVIGRRPIHLLTLSELHKDVASAYGKDISQLSPADLAEYLLSSGASHGEMAQFFDPDSMNAMVDAGLMSPIPPELYDPAIRGERDAPLGEFSQRFLDDSGAGLQRGLLNTDPRVDEHGNPIRGVDVGEFAFQNDVTDKMRQLAISEGEIPPVRAHFGPIEPPAASAILGATTRGIGGALIKAEAVGDEHISNIVETISRDQVDTAPAWLYDQEASKKYTDDWWWDQQREAGKKMREGDIGSGIAQSIGSYIGWAGRSRDIMGGALQTFHGHIMANILYNGWVDSDLFAMGAEDKERIKWLATANHYEDDRVAAARRAFFNDNARGWHWGLKGLAEGLLTLRVEMLIKGPMVMFGPVGALAKRAPGFKEAAKLATKHKGRTITAVEQALIKRGVPNVFKLSRRQKRKAFYDRANRVNLFQGEIVAALQTVVMGAGRNVNQILDNLEKFSNPLTRLDETFPQLMRDPDIRNPNGLFSETAMIIKGHEKWHRTRVVKHTGIEERYLAPEAQRAYDDLQFNGARASKKTFEMYDSDTPPPLPLGDLGTKKFREPPVDGSEWSVGKIINDVEKIISRRYAESIEWGLGQKVRKYGFWGEGNTNIAKWMSDFTKRQLGFAWLFGRAGFIVLNYGGGFFLTAMQQRVGLARAGVAGEWMQKMNVNSKGAFNQDLLLGYRTTTDEGMMTKALTGQQIPMMGTSALQELPLIGNRLLPFHIPKEMLNKNTRISAFARRLEAAPGLAGGIAKASMFLEAKQHKLIQQLELEKIAKYNFSKYLEGLDLPAGTKNTLRKWFDDADARLFDDEILAREFGEMALREMEEGGRLVSRRLARELAETIRGKHADEVAKTKGPASAIKWQSIMREELDRMIPYDVHDPFVRQAISETLDEMFERHLSQGLEVSQQDFIDAGRLASQNHLKYTNQAVDQVMAHSPDGTVGKLAWEIMQVYKETGAAVNDTTHAIIAQMMHTDMVAVNLQTEVLDAMSHRIGTFAGANSDASHEIITDVIARFNKVKVRHTKEIAENMGTLRRSLDAIDRRTAKSLKARLTGDDALANTTQRQARRAAAEESHRITSKRIAERTRDDLAALADELTSDDMVRTLKDSGVPTAKGAGGVEIPEILVTARTVLQSIGQDITAINRRAADTTKAVNIQYKGDLTSPARIKSLRAIHKRRREDIEAIYDKVKIDFPQLELPNMELDISISEGVMKQIVKDVENIKGGDKLSRWLSDDPTHQIRRAGEEQAEAIATAMDDIAERWGLPDELGPSPHARTQIARDTVPSPDGLKNPTFEWAAYKAQGTLDNPQRLQTGGLFSNDPIIRDGIVETVIEPQNTSLYQIQSIRDRALRNGREHAAERSNEALFSYIYNRPETIIQVLAPYPYWSMKFFTFQARQALKTPGQFAVFTELMYDWIEETEDLPDHLQMTVRVFTMPDGTQIRFDPKVLLGGPHATAILSLVNRGNDEEYANSAYQMVQLMNLVYSGAAHPWISAVTHAAVEAVGPDKVQDMMSDPQLYQEILGEHGYIPPMDRQMQSLLGTNQRMVTSAMAQGMIGPEGHMPAMVYERGLSSYQRIQVGHAIADKVERNEITAQEARQAIIDIQQAKPNAIALEAMQEYFSAGFGQQIGNWFMGGWRRYTPQYQRSRQVNKQYRELKSQGRPEEAQALLDSEPSLPVRWMINDDFDEQEAQVNKAAWWNTYEEVMSQTKHRIEQTDILDITERRELFDEARRRLEVKQEELGLSDSDINPKDDNKPVVRDGDTGIPFLRNYRERGIKYLVDAYKYMIQSDDFTDERNVLDHELYENARDEWIETHVPPEMLEEFHTKLKEKISLPEAILKVYKDTYVRDYFDKTENISPAEREEYIQKNPAPSIEQLVRAVREAYPKRNWVNAGEDIDIALNNAKIRSKIEDESLGIRGYLDVIQKDKIGRVRKSSVGDPYAFESKTGLVVNKETIGEYSQAYEDISRFFATEIERREFDTEIDRLTKAYRDELANLTPMDFALGDDDPIRDRYYGEKGTGGLVGRLRNLKDTAILEGHIAKWTDLADKWFGNNEYGREDALRRMSDEYHRVVPNLFATNEGIDWGAYNVAKERKFEEVLETMGGRFNISSKHFQRHLDRHKGASEAAWIYWQEAYIGPALEERAAVKDRYGRVSFTAHAAVSQKYSRSVTVKEVLSEILDRFPDLKAEDFQHLLLTELPSFPEYWQARYPSMSRSTGLGSGGRSGNFTDVWRNFLAQNPTERLPSSMGNPNV